MDHLFFENWQSLLRTLIITILAYTTMVFMLRGFGKRTLSKMNAFDFIVTVALGSSLATVALNKGVPLANGALAFLLLMSLQFIITWLSVRVRKVKEIITNNPTLLLYKGEVFHNILKKERITMEEIYVAARKKGIAELKDIDVIVLETTGDITVISKMATLQAETLKDVEISADKTADIYQ